jgi:predicted DNA-binding protein
MSTDKMITFTFDMEPEAHTKLKKLAEDGYRTLAAEVRLAVDEHIEFEGKKARRKTD